ncbi:MAG: asparagine synthase (glutamine-hydrolyzing) [Acidobacteria bacterium]|nr:asparagine synthase (glutamine-hydrolyzing) [Acidobacteriota bacterium]
MSGIVGIWDLEGRPLDPALIKRMMDRMAHRGPDGANHWISGSVGLGHRLLRTTPESLSEKEPISDARGECLLVWDGRIDNRDELLSVTGLHGDELQRSDADLLLAAYRRWDLECVKRILGDFAFAVWDAKKQRLFCARDPFGVKPFYYHWDGRRFIFASEIKSLLDHPAVVKRPNESMIADYLLMDFRDPEVTFFEGIKQLRPAYFLCVEKGSLSLHRYWDFDPSANVHYSGDEEYLDEFRNLFRKSVQCRLRAKSPAGMLLSGGVDSTAVTAMAESIRLGNGQAPELEAFTLLAEGLRQEEWDAIERLKQKCGTQVHSIPQRKDYEPLTLFEVFLHPGETLHHDVFLTVPAILNAAAARGCRILLTGLGADELSQYGEIGFLKDLLRSGRLTRLLREAAAGSTAYGGDGNGRPMVLKLLWTELPPRIRWLVKMISGRQVPQWFQPSFADRVNLKWRTERQTPRRFPTLCQEETRHCLTAAAWTLGMNYVDELTSGFSIECRHPYADRRLVKFFLAIPPETRMKFGHRKMFVQRALEEVVPGPPRPREGSTYFVPEMDPQRCRDAEAHRMKESLLQDGAMLFEYVDRQEALRIVDQYLRGEAKKSKRNLLWSFVKLELWLQKWFS